MTDLRPWERPLGCLLKLIVAFGVAIAVMIVLAVVLGVFSGIVNAGTGGGRGAAVVDEDTLRWRGERVHLAGMDAPEHRQSCRGGYLFRIPAPGAFRKSMNDHMENPGFPLDA